MIFTSGDFKFRLTEALSNLPVERTFTLTSFLNSSGLPKRLISLNVADSSKKVLCVSENGYGKKTELDDFPTHNRCSCY